MGAVSRSGRASPGSANPPTNNIWRGGPLGAQDFRNYNKYIYVGVEYGSIEREKGKILFITVGRISTSAHDAILTQFHVAGKVHDVRIQLGLDRRQHGAVFQLNEVP